jgi:hypothetical protein
VQTLQFKLRTPGKLLFRARCEEAIDRGLLGAELRIEGAIET